MIGRSSTTVVRCTRPSPRVLARGAPPWLHSGWSKEQRPGPRDRTPRVSVASARLHLMAHSFLPLLNWSGELVNVCAPLSPIPSRLLFKVGGGSGRTPRVVKRRLLRSLARFHNPRRATPSPTQLPPPRFDTPPPNFTPSTGVPLHPSLTAEPPPGPSVLLPPSLPRSLSPPIPLRGPKGPGGGALSG